MCIYCHKFRTIHAEWETCSCGTTGACELNEEYCKIAEARIKHWMSKPKQEKLF